jgi:hypothetical protein
MTRQSGTARRSPVPSRERWRARESESGGSWTSPRPVWTIPCTILHIQASCSGGRQRQAPRGPCSPLPQPALSPPPLAQPCPYAASHRRQLSPNKLTITQCTPLPSSQQRRGAKGKALLPCHTMALPQQQQGGGQGARRQSGASTVASTATNIMSKWAIDRRGHIDVRTVCTRARM